MKLTARQEEAILPASKLSTSETRRILPSTPTLRSGPELGLAETLRSEEAPMLSAVRPTSAAEISPGTLVQGHYRIEETIGIGAMGLVLRAHDERLDRSVAIKLVRPGLLSQAFRDRFAQEARAMARINHPNVLHVYDSGEHQGVPFLAMELVEGTTLEAWHAEEARPVELTTALRILEEICLGVAAIHEAGTVHRDLKPSNILLDHHKRPRVADLGLAMLVSSSDADGKEIAGSPPYMAPETASQRRVDPALLQRADVYSLGCIAYELLTGDRPFRADTLSELMDKHAFAPVPRPSSIYPHLAPFDDCILDALAKDPLRRTPTPEAFRRALAAARDGGAEPVRILVAEDDEDFRELIRIALEREFPDSKIQCVSDGTDALAAFDAAPPSVAIIDLHMPTLGGIELTGRIRARQSSERVPILVLTGEGGPEEWRRLSALGADRFFVKPVIIDDVISAVRRALKERTGPPRSQ